MENSQTERLLKIAETDPELAHKIADFMKESDKISAKSVTEVKIIKDEEDKLVITDEQKRWALGYVITCCFAVVLFIIFFISLSIAMNANAIKNPGIVVFSMIGVFALIILFGKFCLYKSSFPTAKAYFFKHFKFQ